VKPPRPGLEVERAIHPRVLADLIEDLTAALRRHPKPPLRDEGWERIEDAARRAAWYYPRPRRRLPAWPDTRAGAWLYWRLDDFSDGSGRWVRVARGGGGGEGDSPATVGDRDAESRRGIDRAAQDIGVTEDEKPAFTVVELGETLARRERDDTRDRAGKWIARKDPNWGKPGSRTGAPLRRGYLCSEADVDDRWSDGRDHTGTCHHCQLLIRTRDLVTARERWRGHLPDCLEARKRKRGTPSKLDYQHRFHPSGSFIEVDELMQKAA